MLNHLNPLPKYPANAKKGTKRLYLFLSGFLMLFLFSALTVSGLSKFIIGTELTATMASVMMPSFFLFSILAFFQRKELRKSPYTDSYKAMTRMIKHQTIGIFLLALAFAWFFDHIFINEADSSSTLSTSASGTISFFLAIGGTVGLYLYGFYGTLKACWLYRKNIIK